MAGCADQVKRVTLELGGKSANIVFADADLAAAAASAPYAVFDNAGQDCCARSRILVAAHRRTTSSSAGSSRRSRACGCSTRPTSRREMGPLISAGQRDVGAAATSTRPSVAFAGIGARRRRASGSPPTVVLPTTPTSADLARGGLRPGRRGDAVRRRGATRSRWPTTPSTACPARSSPATSAGRCGSRARSRPATSASTRTRRCATGRRSAATSSPASAASSARTRRTRSPRRRTSSSLTEPTRLDLKAGTPHGRTASRARSPSSPAAARASAWRPCSRFVEEGAKVVIGDIDDAARARARRPSSAAPTWRRTCTST